MPAALDKGPILERVYQGICDGKSLEAICAEDGMPHTSTVYRWLVDSEYCEEYTRAKAVRAERFFDRIIAVAEDDNMRPDDKRVRIDAYKWAAGKFAGKYSDKVKHVGGDEGDNPIAFTGWSISFE